MFNPFWQNSDHVLRDGVNMPDFSSKELIGVDLGGMIKCTKCPCQHFREAEE